MTPDQIEAMTGHLYAVGQRSRTWRERLFSWPWRPWVKWETTVRGIVTDVGLVSPIAFEMTVTETDDRDVTI